MTIADIWFWLPMKYVFNEIYNYILSKISLVQNANQPKKKNIGQIIKKIACLKKRTCVPTQFLFILIFHAVVFYHAGISQNTRFIYIQS